MRVGNSYSLSYRRLHSRRARRHQIEVARLCSRLDRLVERAEKLGLATATRAALLASAASVREKLRAIDY